MEYKIEENPGTKSFEVVFDSFQDETEIEEVRLMVLDNGRGAAGYKRGGVTYWLPIPFKEGDRWAYETKRVGETD